MNKFKKRLYKLLESPASLHFKEIRTILAQLDFKEIQAKGSHIKLKHKKLKYDLIIPIHNQDCKVFYKKQIAKTILFLIYPPHA